MIRRLSILFCTCLISSASLAADYCDLDTALAAYNSAIKRQKLGDVEAAHKTFLELADHAVAPAQRHVAKYYLEESRDQNALENAVMWAQLAVWGGDQEAGQIFKRLVETSRYEVEQTGQDWARYWKPRQPDCRTPSTEDKGDDDFRTIGRFPVIRHEDLDEETFARVVTRLSEALETVDQVAPYFSSLVQLIPAFEIIHGEGTDRHIDWDANDGVLKISSGYFNDKTARQLSYSLALAVQRLLFAKIKDATFVDQIAVTFGSIKVYGSLYGDVKTKRFLKLAKDALKLSHKLPTVFYDQVKNLDEIHYMPPSRYHLSSLPYHDAFSHYDHMRSSPDRRMVVVNHKIGFESAEDLLLDLVKLGTQAQQHAVIDQLRAQVGGDRREDAILKALEGQMDEAKAIFSQNASRQKKLIDSWDEFGPEGIARFYCDAVYNQVKAAIVMKLQSNKVNRMVKFRECKKARDAWRNRKKIKSNN